MNEIATRKLIQTLEIKTTLARIQQLFQERNELRQKINEARVLEDLIFSTERESKGIRKAGIVLGAMGLLVHPACFAVSKKLIKDLPL
ncbi:MAG: hypothetical protein I3274_02620 [Candidatus Moeniiplasma glomeromycotorum]|nr:hypothetical protein [Candidatus Moeniiplasma glomeromycotorum]MCE8167498.1 hypothetical protein [Candidatus Moeniiplasma glomeromycotorum]